MSPLLPDRSRTARVFHLLQLLIAQHQLIATEGVTDDRLEQLHALEAQYQRATAYLDTKGKGTRQTATRTSPPSVQDLCDPAFTPPTPKDKGTRR